MHSTEFHGAQANGGENLYHKPAGRTLVGYSQRRAVIGSTRLARHAGM
jgi:hypothetical protein